MPILQFYTSPNQLTSAEKEELVKVITERYTLRLPAFFVNVMFNEVSLAFFLISLSIPAQISLSSPSAISDQSSSHYPVTHYPLPLPHTPPSSASPLLSSPLSSHPQFSYCPLITETGCTYYYLLTISF